MIYIHTVEKKILWSFTDYLHVQEMLQRGGILKWMKSLTLRWGMDISKRWQMKDYSDFQNKTKWKKTVEKVE